MRNSARSYEVTKKKRYVHVRRERQKEREREAHDKPAFESGREGGERKMQRRSRYGTADRRDGVRKND